MDAAISSSDANTVCLSAPHADIHPFFRGTLPVPPSINNSYRIVRINPRNARHESGGMRIANTPEAIQFKDNAAIMLSQGYHDWSLINAIRASRLRVPLEVTMDVYFSSEKRDLDNVIKIAQDAVFSRLELNDNLVDELHVIKYLDKREEPRIEVTVRCLLKQ